MTQSRKTMNVKQLRYQLISYHDQANKDRLRRAKESDALSNLQVTLRDFADAAQNVHALRSKKSTKV
jgi:hypothetical protein